MGRYVTRKRARFKSILGIDVNIPWGAVLEEQGGLLFWRGAAVCGQGEVRGRLVGAIMARLERRDSGYQPRWDKVWKDHLCQKYRRPEHEDWWLWSYDFFNAPIADLRYIAALVGARVS